MIEGRKLTTGGTISDRMKEYGEPKTIDELVDNTLEAWDVVLQVYKEEEKETPTYMQMYAMKGAIILVKEFRKDIQEMQDFLSTLKKGE